MRYFPAAFILIVIVVSAVAIFACGDGPLKPASQPTAPQKVFVRMLAAFDQSSGIATRVNKEKHTDVVHIQEPTDLSFELPNRTTHKVTVKMVSIIMYYGIVVDVDFLPLPKTMPYKPARAALDQHLRDFGITPDDEMSRMMRQWPDDAPGFDPKERAGSYPHRYRAGMSVGNDLGLQVELRAANDGGWFTVITFSVTGPTRHRLAIPATRASNDERSR